MKFCKNKLKIKKNNDFLIFFDKKISVKGNKFDASLLPKFLNNKGKIFYQNLVKS